MHEPQEVLTEVRGTPVLGRTSSPGPKLNSGTPGGWRSPAELRTISTDPVPKSSFRPGLARQKLRSFNYWTTREDA